MQPKPLSIFDSITHFYCLLLKILKVSEPFAFIMIFLSCCQNLSFIISSSYLIKILSDDLSQIIYQVLSIFRPLYIINTLYLPSLYRFILIVVMVYMVIYILIIILILYKDLKNSLNVSVLMKIFKRMTYMNFYLWYIPINELFMTPVYCLLVKKTDSIEELFSENLCIGGTWDIFLAILGVFFFGTMTITCLMNVLFCVDMTYNPDNALAKSDSLMELHTFVNKNLLIIQLIFLKYLQKPIFFLMFLVLLEINQIMAFREYTRKPNFFNMRVDKFYGIAISVELYVFSYILVFTVLNVLGSDVNTGMGLLLTILLPLRYFLNTFHNNYLKNLSIRLDLIKTPELIDKKLKLLFSYLISQEGKKAKDPKKRQKFNINYDKKDQTLPIIWGYLFSHYKYCVNMLCFCKNYDDKLFDYRLKYEYRPKQEKLMKNLESSIYLKYFIRQQYKDAISLHKQNLGLRLNLAYFNFFQLNNFHQALLEAFELNEASLHSKELNYRSLFLIKRLELEIRDFLQCLNVNKDKDESYSNFNIEAIQSFEDNYSLMEKKITEFRNLYTQFFIKLSNNSISFLDLEKECNILYNLRVIIQKTFDSLNTNPRAIKLYLGYLNNLVFKNDMGYNLEKKLKELLEKIHSNEGQSMLFYSENLLYNENSMLFQVGGEYKNLGKILRANQGSSKVLGYQKQELELSNISIIMPLRLSRSHDKFLEAFMKTGKNELLYKEKTMFTRKKNGYIISTALLIKPSFDFIVNQFKFLGYLRPLRKPIEYIVTDMYGSIDGMSENLSKLFNVHPKEYEKSIFYIQILCPKLYSFFLERNEKVNTIFMDSSRNSSSHTNRTNRTKKFNEIQELDLMELLDLPKTLSNEAILRFYRFNNGDLFGDLRSIINAIVDKIKKKKIDENGLIGIEQDIPKSSGVDNKWNLVKRKFIKIAMLGNFFNCKTKINYYKSSDHQYEWLVFSITEIEFTRRLKILQMNSRPFLENTSTDKHDTNSFNNLDNSTNKQFTSNSFNQKNSSIINTPPKLPTPIDSSNPTENNNDFKVENINKLPNNNIISIIPNCTNSPKTPSLLSINLNNNAIPSFNSINQNSMSHNKISLNTYNSQIINPNAVNNPYHNSQANNPNAVNPYPSFPTFEKSYTDSKDKTLAKDFNKIPTIIYNNENSPKIQKIVISLENENEVDNLIIASEGTLEIEDLVHERTSYPVDTARKNLDSIIKGEASLPVSSKKKYGRLQTVNSTIKESKENLPCPSLGKNMAYGKTFETMNSSEFNQFNRKLLVPQISLEINPFLDFKKAVNINEGLPPVRNFNPMVHEEDEEKMADRIINFTGERLFEEKSEDLTDHSVKYSGTSPFNRRKSIMSSNLQKKKGIGFRARFNDGVVDEKSSDVKEIGTSFTEKSQKIDSENVNKEDLKIINKTLKDISKGILQGADSNEDDSDKKTIRSTKMANTLKTINSMNKKTNGNVNFTPKTHKLLDVLRETIVKKLALEENQDKKEKAYEQSVHSSISSIYQSNRLTEKAILNPFVPKCYKRLSWSLLFLMIAIFVMQISIYLIIVKLYEDFKDNLVENVNYNRFSNTLLQSIKNILVSDVTSSRNFDQEYYKTFLINSISQEFNELAISINNIQLNYEFYHGLSSNFFTRKTFYNISENVKNINNVENLAFTVFPYDLIKAVTLYLSEMQKFLNSETINLTILLQNLFGFAFEFSYHDNFNSQRNNLIKNNKLTILIILIMISTFIILIFLLRIISHLSCYNYMNDLLEMLAKINYEDIETLKTYYISIASVYDLQQEIKGPGQNGILGINYVENPGALKDNNNNKNRSHRMVDIKYLSIPNSQILFMNFIFCIFIIAINLIVVFLSHGFDNYFESSGNFQKHMLSQFNFKGYTTGYLLSYDHNLGLGIYNMSRNEILTYLNKNLPNETLDLGTYNSQNPFITHYLQVITSEQICRFLTLNTTVLNRCEGLLNGLMNKSLVNFELETAQLLKVMMLDGKKSDIANLAQFGEGLDYALNLTNLLKSQYISSEYNSYDSELKTLILINCFSIICAFIIILGYYVLSLRKLEERLISIRKIYLNIPIAILIRQKRIKKYLQDTSSFFLGG